MSKIEAGKISLNLDNVDLYKLVDDVRDIFQFKAQKKGLQLLIEIDDRLPQYIRTDSAKLRQVLINLISNAIKFTSEGGVSLQVVNKSVQNQNYHKGTDILFIVRDTGEGIEADELKLLFQPFSQTKSGLNSYEGTGLGLSICHKFVQLLGGNIQVKSQINVGTIFSFMINVQEISAIEIVTPIDYPQVIGIEANQTDYKLLIVDDKDINRQLLVKLLKPLQFQLQEASNGQEAVDIWEKWQPHLIFMDMRMPVMNGYEATKLIKATVKGSATAIIAVTASVLDEEKAVILSAGCDDFVRKPFRQETIFAMLNKHLGIRFIYAEHEHNQLTTEIAELTPSALTIMSSQWLDKMYQASIDLDESMILELISQIPDSSSSLSLGLLKLVEKFNFDTITNLIENI